MDEFSDLPIDSRNPATAKKSAEFERRVSGTVLLVEDDAPLLRCLSEMLRYLGYAVISAQDGQEALRLTNDGAVFDLLFADIILPGDLGGCELALEIQRLRPGLPMLLTSASLEHDGSSKKRSLPVGVAFLLKPYKFGDLEDALRGIMKPQKAYAKSA